MNFDKFSHLKKREKKEIFKAYSTFANNVRRTMRVWTLCQVELTKNRFFHFKPMYLGNLDFRLTLSL